MTLPPALELQAVREELTIARAEYRSAERAPFEGRVTDTELHRHSCQRKLLRVVELEKEMGRLRDSIAGGSG